MFPCSVFTMFFQWKSRFIAMASQLRSSCYTTGPLLVTVQYSLASRCRLKCAKESTCSKFFPALLTCNGMIWDCCWKRIQWRNVMTSLCWSNIRHTIQHKLMDSAQAKAYETSPSKQDTNLLNSHVPRSYRSGSQPLRLEPATRQNTNQKWPFGKEAVHSLTAILRSNGGMMTVANRSNWIKFRSSAILPTINLGIEPGSHRKIT